MDQIDENLSSELVLDEQRKKFPDGRRTLLQAVAEIKIKLPMHPVLVGQASMAVLVEDSCPPILNRIVFETGIGAICDVLRCRR